MKKTITLVKALAFATVTAASMNLVQAQSIKNNTEADVKNLPRISKTSAMGNFYANFSGQDISSDFLVNHFNEWLGAGSDHTFKFVKENTDELGIKHKVYQHYFKGIKVADEFILLHEKNGQLTFANGEFSSDINAGAGSAIPQAEAENIATADMKAQGNTSFSNYETVITKIDNGRGVSLHYVTKIDGFSLKPLNAFTYYIDNSTKNIIKKIARSYHADTPSNSSTLYKGTQAITVDSNNGSYRLKDNARNIHTMNAANIDGNFNTSTGLLNGATEYTNATPNFTAAITKPAVEAHWAIEKAHDYYVNRFNRNSYDGNGALIRNYYNVDFGTLQTGTPSGNGFNAAAVDVPGTVTFMVYGNGGIDSSTPSGVVANPFVGIDVAGHEYSHLIIARNGLGGLNYQGESGALNESIADMMGTAIEFYSGINPNWTMGEGMLNPAVIAPAYLRSLSNPNSGPDMLDAHQPDTYHSTFWASTANPNQGNDNGGVHTNSGVGNYWFYLLSKGGSGVNDIGNSFNVTGITIQKAEKIIYRALMNYLTPNATYMDAYNATKQAVTDLYGASGNEQLQNVKAWYAVGIGNGVLATNEVPARAESQFAIYPNPVKNQMFTIENDKAEGAFEIYDLSGKLVKQSEKLTKGINKVNINGVQKGVYLVKIISGGNTVAKKIIVE
ncbi:M4 family metallopeptidase [Chryseobacterium daeguense]|uniref:M4 family metallopeptidase n=1 Tax=Chryseobacterium daeguense TaxID=412438 RepID=UPI000417530D|nr:M4 family metallopeptidase [Chryseobacterium daeguense]